MPTGDNKYVKLVQNQIKLFLVHILCLLSLSNKKKKKNLNKNK